MTTAGPASNAADTATMHSMDHSMSVGMGSSDLGLPESGVIGSHTTTASWRKALDSVVPACVVLKYVTTHDRC